MTARPVAEAACRDGHAGGGLGRVDDRQIERILDYQSRLVALIGLGITSLFIGIANFLSTYAYNRLFDD